MSNGDRESPDACTLALRAVDAPINIPVVVWGRFMLDPTETLGRDEVVNVGNMMLVEEVCSEWGALGGIRGRGLKMFEARPSDDIESTVEDFGGWSAATRG